MFNLLLLETHKIFTKWRTYIGFITIGVIIPLIVLALYFSGADLTKGMIRQFRQEFLIVGNLFNGWFISYLVMNSLFVHIPFLITLVAGDVLAGEATSGTYRILLSRPYTRTTILTIKYIASIFYTKLLVLFLALLSTSFGLAFFGTGDLIFFQEGYLLLLPEHELWWRFIFAYVGAIIAMCTVTSLAFLFSSFVENPIGPIISTMAVIIILLIIGELPIEFFQNLRPYLFTTYFTIWMKAFEEPINLQLMITWAIYLLLYSFTFFILTLYIFRRKDILS